MTILIDINNGQPIPLMWYLFILLFLENIANILTTGPSLVCLQFVIVVFPDHTHLLFLCLFLAVPVRICLWSVIKAVLGHMPLFPVQLLPAEILF